MITKHINGRTSGGKKRCEGGKKGAKEGGRSGCHAGKRMEGRGRAQGSQKTERKGEGGKEEGTGLTRISAPWLLGLGVILTLTHNTHSQLSSSVTRLHS